MVTPPTTEPVSLQAYNSLRLPAYASDCITIAQSAALLEVSHRLAKRPRCILGGGTNLVIRGSQESPLQATVLINQLKGIVRLSGVVDHQVRIRCAAGESWQSFVMWTLAQGLAGLENLAGIPGTVGAAPIQNIGAYGVEVAEQIEAVHVWDFHQHDHAVLSAQDCAFGYRDSLFKNPEIQGPWNAPRYLVTAVDFRLWTDGRAPLRLGYSGIGQKLLDLGIDHQPNAYQVAHAVMSLRGEKLPDPDQHPNVGSFFKNPQVPDAFAASLAQKHPELPRYPQSGGTKLSAAWLIEQAGLKGWADSRAGVSSQHALVLVNQNEATAEDIQALARVVQRRVMGQFGVWLEPEPVYWPAG